MEGVTAPGVAKAPDTHRALADTVAAYVSLAQ